ncbi:DUF4232 domain-containing protein [Streptomyces sp. VRA16 Mangrove soil]|uniref:DUF4232 domain-containing protein n=1 Tax=Streptomyces sp. VRA16 Mangrove soil TaxID=2817434 RepID=UPI001A9F5BC0|nr:DUF4232 domain-containing protein [Streptomyces sp. VRA16 Mangrove soil]MBO1331558.1 DUF4232 domain-containing protein [Streptomyces sp. VRA16 Mangrove soil]
MRAQKLTIAAVALAAGLSLTACQGHDDSASGSDDAGSGAPSSASSPAASGSSSSASGSSGSSGSSSSGSSSAGGSTGGGSNDGSGGGQINTGPCKTANLSFTTSHGMGEGDFMVAMKNTSDACSLKGFPGVDLKGEGAPEGTSAVRSKVAPVTVVLKSGEQTRFHLHYEPNTSGGSGFTFTTLVVTPPNETHSTSLPVSINVPISEDGTGNLTVDPVGTGKQ